MSSSKVAIEPVRMGVITDPEQVARAEVAALAARLAGMAHDPEKSVSVMRVEMEKTALYLRRQAGSRRTRPRR